MQPGDTFTWATDAAGKLLEDLPAWQELTGQSGSESRGLGWQDAIHPEDRARVQAAWQEAVERSEPFIAEYRVVYGERTRLLSVHGVPVLEEDGSRRFVGLGQDVTDAELDRRLLDAVIDSTPVGIAVTWGRDFRIRRHNDPYEALLPPGRGALGRTAAEALGDAGVLPFFEQVRDTGEVLRFEDYAAPWPGPEAIDGHRFYDFSLHPLPDADGAVGGVLVVAVETTAAVRRRRELQHQLDRERRTAEVLQEALLPPAPVVDGLRIAVRYLPGGPAVQVGGDWYDAFELPDGRAAVVVGDVAGRGVEAARLMSQLRAAVRAYGLEGHAPEVVVGLVEEFFGGQELADMATMVYAELSADRRSVTWMSAGHPPLVLGGGDGTARLLRGGLVPPVGAGGAVGTPGRLELAPGSIVLLYTDGLVEDRRRPLEIGLERLVAVLAATASDGAEAVCDAVLAEVLADPARADDVALLAFEVL